MDKIFDSWLRTQQREALRLAAASDVLDVKPLLRPNLGLLNNPASPSPSATGSPNAVARPTQMPGAPCQYYLATFRCNGYILQSATASNPEVLQNAQFCVGIHFPDDYLRVANFYRVLTLISPYNFWHPNARHPHLCVGHLAAGTGLVDILYQIFEIITLRKATIREDDSLNPIACQWFRTHWDGKPVDVRPLRRRQLKFNISPQEG